MLDLSARSRAYVIAEAGTNHAAATKQERLKRAVDYASAAAMEGADAIKFQIFRNPIKDDFFCWIEGDEERSKRWEMSELERYEWRVVKEACDAFGIDFLASCFQHSTVEWLSQLRVRATKVASRAARTFPYRNAPAPWLISTGMGLPPRDIARDRCAYLLQCEANYPSTSWWGYVADDEGVTVPPGTGVKLHGFSDHSGNPWRAIDAIGHGCKLVEVHFYMSPEHAGPDYPASLTLNQLKLVCEARDHFAAKETA